MIDKKVHEGYNVVKCDLTCAKASGSLQALVNVTCSAFRPVSSLAGYFLPAQPLSHNDTRGQVPNSPPTFWYFASIHFPTEWLKRPSSEPRSWLDVRFVRFSRVRTATVVWVFADPCDFYAVLVLFCQCNSKHTKGQRERVFFLSFFLMGLYKATCNSPEQSVSLSVSMSFCLFFSLSLYLRRGNEHFKYSDNTKCGCSISQFLLLLLLVVSFLFVVGVSLAWDAIIHQDSAQGT